MTVNKTVPFIHNDETNQLANGKSIISAVATANSRSKVWKHFGINGKENGKGKR